MCFSVVYFQSINVLRNHYKQRYRVKKTSVFKKLHISHLRSLYDTKSVKISYLEMTDMHDLLNRERFNVVSLFKKHDSTEHGFSEDNNTL